MLDTDRDALLQTLVEHGVQFVLIGGAAIQSHGRRYDTNDVDVVPDAEATNLARLAAALNSLECRLVTDSADASAWVALPEDYFTPRSLRAATVWNLATRHGQLDVTFAPSGFPDGYHQLAANATRRPVAGTNITLAVAALDDIHESNGKQTDRKTASTFAKPTPKATGSRSSATLPAHAGRRSRSTRPTNVGNLPSRCRWTRERMARAASRNDIASRPRGRRSSGASIVARFQGLSRSCTSRLSLPCLGRGPLWEEVWNAAALRAGGYMIRTS